MPSVTFSLAGTEFSDQACIADRQDLPSLGSTETRRKPPHRSSASGQLKIEKRPSKAGSFTDAPS